ncbi:MAG: hypothetical protein K1X87_00310 [Dehalococcoidia bacterium]|nr:hypothetical protein [Dehalococcoidia bacterium]
MAEPNAEFTMLRSSAVQWLLGLAAVCLLAQSTLIPIAAPAAAAWDPAHAHLTLNGVIPPHRHVFSLGTEDGQKGCVVSTPDRSLANASTGEDVVCAASNSGETATVALAVHASAPAADVGLAGFESSAAPAALPGWFDVTAEVQTPPPRA